MGALTTDTVPRVCACPECLGLALDDGPLCEDCTAAAPPAAVAAWRDARDELRAAQVAGETGASAVWMRALLDCERAAVHRPAAVRSVRMSPAITDCTPVVLVELVTDPRAAGLCDCGEREPAEGSDTCEVCAGEAVL